MFQDKVAVITGGAQSIGKCIAEEFRKNGAYVGWGLPGKKNRISCCLRK